jgi:hypothetical protein
MKELTTKESRTRGLRAWRIGLLTLTLGTLLSTGCAGQNRSVSAGADLRKPEEEPRVVDCLLPSQVRHLGQLTLSQRPSGYQDVCKKLRDQRRLTARTKRHIAQPQNRDG